MANRNEKKSGVEEVDTFLRGATRGPTEEEIKDDEQVTDDIERLKQQMREEKGEDQDTFTRGATRGPTKEELKDEEKIKEDIDRLKEEMKKEDLDESEKDVQAFLEMMFGDGGDETVKAAAGKSVEKKADFVKDDNEEPADPPPGATPEEVADDIPAYLSTGEYVLPANVVRYIGLKNVVGMHKTALREIQQMEDLNIIENVDENGMVEEDDNEMDYIKDDPQGAVKTTLIVAKAHPDGMMAMPMQRGGAVTDVTVGEDKFQEVPGVGLFERPKTVAPVDPLDTKDLTDITSKTQFESGDADEVEQPSFDNVEQFNKDTVGKQISGNAYSAMSQVAGKDINANNIADFLGGATEAQLSEVATALTRGEGEKTKPGTVLEAAKTALSTFIGGNPLAGMLPGVVTAKGFDGVLSGTMTQKTNTPLDFVTQAVNKSHLENLKEMYAGNPNASIGIFGGEVVSAGPGLFGGTALTGNFEGSLRDFNAIMTVSQGLEPDDITGKPTGEGLMGFAPGSGGYNSQGQFVDASGNVSAMGSEQAYNRLTEKEKEAVQAAREKRGGLFDRLFGITKETKSQEDTTDKSAAPAKEQQQASDESAAMGDVGAFGAPDARDESAAMGDVGAFRSGGVVTRKRYGGLMGQ